MPEQGLGEDGSSPLGNRAAWAGAERASAPQQHPGVTAWIARELAELNTPRSPSPLGSRVWSSWSRAVWWPTARGPPCCSRALTSVVMMRAPLAPSGWPIAIAPPLTLVLAEVFNILRDWYNNRAGRDDQRR